MDSARKKRLIFLVVVLITVVGLFLLDMFDSGQEDNENITVNIEREENDLPVPIIEQNETTPTVQNDTEKAISAVEPVPEEIFIQQIVLPSSPENFPSPFAMINNFENPVANNNVNNFSSLPEIPPMTGDMPVFPTDFQLPDMPSIAAMSSVSGGRDVFLKAVLYKPGESNMAILDDGTIETIVKEGDSSPWGYVSKITASTVTLGGRTLSLEI